jgi:hypothetical protein
MEALLVKTSSNDPFYSNPDVGGIPYSKALKKSSSMIPLASSSPLQLISFGLQNVLLIYWIIKL